MKLTKDARFFLTNFGQRRGTVPEHIADQLPPEYTLRRAEQVGPPPFNQPISALSTLTDEGFAAACLAAKLAASK